MTAVVQSRRTRQTRVNKRLMIAFKKRVDGLLVGAEVQELRRKLGLSQAEAARVFGGGPVAFSKYENDEVTQSEAMDKLLRLAVELPPAFDLLRRRAGQSRLISRHPEITIGVFPMNRACKTTFG